MSPEILLVVALAGPWEGATQRTALPTQIESMSVTVGGKPAYLAYISPTQQGNALESAACSSLKRAAKVRERSN